MTHLLSHSKSTLTQAQRLCQAVLRLGAICLWTGINGILRPVFGVWQAVLWPIMETLGYAALLFLEEVAFPHWQIWSKLRHIRQGVALSVLTPIRRVQESLLEAEAKARLASSTPTGLKRWTDAQKQSTQKQNTDMKRLADRQGARARSLAASTEMENIRGLDDLFTRPISAEFFEIDATPTQLAGSTRYSRAAKSTKATQPLPAALAKVEPLTAPASSAQDGMRFDDAILQKVRWEHARQKKRQTEADVTVQAPEVKNIQNRQDQALQGELTLVGAIPPSLQQAESVKPPVFVSLAASLQAQAVNASADAEVRRVESVSLENELVQEHHASFALENERLGVSESVLESPPKTKDVDQTKSWLGWLASLGKKVEKPERLSTAVFLPNLEPRNAHEPVAERTSSVGEPLNEAKSQPPAAKSAERPTFLPADGEMTSFDHMLQNNLILSNSISNLVNKYFDQAAREEECGNY